MEYKGEWQGGTPNGEGELTFDGVLKIKGVWKLGNMNGAMGISCPTFKISCFYKEGQLDGDKQGEIDYFEKYKYSGGIDHCFRFDKKGTLSYLNMIIWGEWEAGVEKGHFKILFKEGHTIEGEMKDGVFTGDCEIIYSNGDVYLGRIQKYVPHGLGEYKYSNGDSYEGEFSVGELSGRGSFLFESGDKYTGGFEKGLKNGEGTYFFESGGRAEVVFKEDELVEVIGGEGLTG